jgi:Rne/Rng family ribonuclease
MNEHRHALGPGEFGLVIRTAAAGAPDDWITCDIAQVVHNWRDCMERRSRTASPACVGGRQPHVIACTEWAVPMPDALIYRNDEIVDDFRLDEVLSDARISQRIERFDGADLFDHYGVWDEIEKLKSPRVDLPSGAWMAIEPTRAMVTVDVNTAGEFGGGAALTANLEAAKELPRQLRLRGLGGQVTIDFAPLPKKDRRRIEDALKTSFRRDPVDTALAGWTPLGHFELQRKRERRPLSELLG